MKTSSSNLIPVLIGVVIAVVAAIAILLEGDYDVLRYIVLGEIAVVFLLYCFAFRQTVVRAEHDPDPPTRQLRIGRAVMQLGVLIWLVVTFFEVNDRVGHADLNPVTPSIQFVIICLVIAWMLVERLQFISDPQQVVEEIKKAEAPDDPRS